MTRDLGDMQFSTDEKSVSEKTGARDKASRPKVKVKYKR